MNSAYELIEIRGNKMFLVITGTLNEVHYWKQLSESERPKSNFIIREIESL